MRKGCLPNRSGSLPKYFYDELGSRLFDAICLLPEYYLTRAENEIIERYADEIVSSVDGHKTLLEMGSGSASKTRLIVEALLKKQDDLLFIPVDISASALESSSRILLQSFPRLRIEAYAADYFDSLSELEHETDEVAHWHFSLAQTSATLAGMKRLIFCALCGSVLRAGDALLLGADLKKDRSILEPAYDDALGVTAAFNLNLLARVNRELDGDFDLRAFKHHAFYNEEMGRVEIYIESTRPQTVRYRQAGI